MIDVKIIVTEKKDTVIETEETKKANVYGSMLKDVLYYDKDFPDALMTLLISIGINIRKERLERLKREGVHKKVWEEEAKQFTPEEQEDSTVEQLKAEK